MASVRAGVRRLGFGAAKLRANPDNEEALSTALKLGVRVIDTSPNYNEGGSETAIGHVLRRPTSPQRAEVDLYSKYGYYFASAHGGKPAPDSVSLGDSGVYYSMHPEAMRGELKASLQRLRTDYLDVLFVHNPEHYLADLFLQAELGGAKGKAVDPAAIKEQQERLKSRLVGAFVGLEEMVGEGKIKSYGVSSNALALPTHEPLHLPLSDILTAATEAAAKVNRPQPSLSCIQLPLNLLEAEGLSIASKAKQAGLQVVVNRPLTPVVGGGLYRLVDQPSMTEVEPPTGYMEACQAALEYFRFSKDKDISKLTPEEKETLEGCQVIQNLIRDLNKELVNFTSVAHYESELERKIIPMLTRTFESLDEDAVEKIQAFFVKYGEMVRYNTANKTRELVASPTCPTGPHKLVAGQTLQDYSLRWLFARCPEVLDVVLVGMYREDYVLAAVKAASS